MHMQSFGDEVNRLVDIGKQIEFEQVTLCNILTSFQRIQTIVLKSSSCSFQSLIVDIYNHSVHTIVNRIQCLIQFNVRN